MASFSSPTVFGLQPPGSHRKPASIMHELSPHAAPWSPPLEAKAEAEKAKARARGERKLAWLNAHNSAADAEATSILYEAAKGSNLAALEESIAKYGSDASDEALFRASNARDNLRRESTDRAEIALRAAELSAAAQLERLKPINAGLQQAATETSSTGDEAEASLVVLRKAIAELAGQPGSKDAQGSRLRKARALRDKLAVEVAKGTKRKKLLQKREQKLREEEEPAAEVAEEAAMAKVGEVLEMERAAVVAERLAADAVLGQRQRQAQAEAKTKAEAGAKAEAEEQATAMATAIATARREAEERRRADEEQKSRAAAIAAAEATTAAEAADAAEAVAAAAAAKAFAAAKAVATATAVTKPPAAQPPPARKGRSPKGRPSEDEQMQQALEVTASAEKERQVALAAREADELAKAIAVSLETSDAHAPAEALEPSGSSGEASPTTLGALAAAAGAVLKGRGRGAGKAKTRALLAEANRIALETGVKEEANANAKVQAAVKALAEADARAEEMRRTARVAAKAMAEARDRAEAEARLAAEAKAVAEAGCKASEVARQPADAESTTRGHVARGGRGRGEASGRGRGRSGVRLPCMAVVEATAAETAASVASPGDSPTSWAVVATASLEERPRPQVSPERVTEAEQEAESSPEEAEAAVAQQVLTLADVGNITGRNDVPESTIGGETTCIVCMARPKTHLAVPCAHQCACGTCAARLQLCPYCRAPVQAWLEVRVV